ncbi:hypothetical protein QYF61_007606 [Mycteria americana]|uniref:Uncharacterized protein n=1 Tax=Mycteria americana TaxID=33587 RepID=A0AAN7RS81_MYCAM|nr:hypothetical protein QYF61_007606 [Mycteria americana]
MLDNPFSEDIFPNIQSKPPLVQPEAISSHPITCYLGEETDPHLSTTSFQAVVESDKVSPQPPFLQAKQPQLPQPLLIRLVLQTLHQLRCPSLDTLQHLNVSLVAGGPKLSTVFEVQPHQCRVQGHDHFPSPAGHAISHTSQDAIGLLGHLGTLPGHIQAAVNQHSQVLFCQAAFQPLCPKPVALHGVAVTQSLPTLKQINIPAQLAVVCKLTEGALDPLVQVIDKDIKRNWPQHRALGNTACDRLPSGVNSIHYNSLGPAIQPVLYPAKSTPIQAMSSQFLQENAVENRGWQLNHFPGQPVPMLDNPFSEVKFPNIQSKPPLVQLEAISSRPITCYLGEETDPHLSTTSFQAVVESNKVSPQPPFLQAKQPQFPQPLLIRLVLQTLHQLHCPSLDTLQHLNVSLVVGGPKLNTGFEVRPAGHAISHTSQDAIFKDIEVLTGSPWYQIQITHGLEKTFRIIESNRKPKLPSPPLRHVPKHHIYMCCQYL